MEADQKHDSKSRRVLLIAWSAVIILVFCASTGLVLARQQRIQRQTGELAQAAAQGPHVLVTRLAGGASSRTLDLPASVHGYVETPVYAKTAGSTTAVSLG